MNNDVDMQGTETRQTCQEKKRLLLMPRGLMYDIQGQKGI
jgi:hypothetical protein